MPTTSREIRLRRRPAGMPVHDDFELAEARLPDPPPGSMLVRTVWMSVDPYMRGRMNESGSHSVPFALGAPLDGHFVGEVVASNGGRFDVGTYVSGVGGGWREFHVASGQGLFTVDPGLAPLPAWLGVLGMPGQTAYVGLLDIGRPRPGETVLVSAASGAVGGVVCQIARALDCRVVGTAGSAEKCAWLRDVAGVDAAVDWRAAGDGLRDAIAAHCPDGVDVYFENVGGAHLEAALDLMNQGGRIPLCGMIGGYNAAGTEPGPRNLFLAVRKRLLLKGFIVSDHRDRLPDFYRDMTAWLRAGRVSPLETAVDGLENAIDAFLGLFRGANMGKMVVRVGPDRA